MSYILEYGIIAVSISERALGWYIGDVLSFERRMSEIRF